MWPEIMALNSRPGVVNLGQGFPDFEPSELVPSAIAGAVEGLNTPSLNQYSPIAGLPELNEAIADTYKAMYKDSERLNPKTEICTVTSATLGLYSAMMGLLDEGDEVIMFEPFFPWYLPCARLAGGKPVIIELKAPQFAVLEEDLESAFSSKTKVIVVNSPHNPTGHCLTKAELELIARYCKKHDVICVSDEVYETMTFAGTQHLRIADLEGMADRTLTVSGAGKTMSLTGWRVGWVCGAADLVGAVRTVHGFATYCCPVPLQKGVAAGLRDALARNDFTFGGVAVTFEENYKLLASALEKTGAKVCDAQGGYFLVADISHTGMSDLEYTKWLVEHKKVGCVPLRMFFGPKEDGSMVERPLVRFAICKQRDCIEEAVRNLLA